MSLPNSPPFPFPFSLPSSLSHWLAYTAVSRLPRISAYQRTRQQMPLVFVEDLLTAAQTKKIKNRHLGVTQLSPAVSPEELCGRHTFLLGGGVSTGCYCGSDSSQDVQSWHQVLDVTLPYLHTNKFA